MKKILFPTDFSKAADNAFVFALEMCQNLNSELIVLHVYGLPVISYEGYPSYVMDVYELINLNTFENFRDEIPHLREIAERHGFGSISMSHILEEGDLVAIMKRIVKEEEIDMIVMGTTGASGLEEIFMGSNASAVINKIPLDTLLIPAKAKFGQIKNIGFTTLFRDKDREALKHVVQLAKKMESKVKCLYVKSFESKVEPVQMEQWEDDFKNDPVEFMVIPGDDINAVVFGFLGQHKIDVLAMLNYKHGFFEGLFKQSLVKQLTFHSKTPLLVIPER